MGRPRSFDDDVVDRAMDAFWTHGDANTSPARLAATTGIAKGSLYNAFGSKRDLFDRALARYGELVSQLGQDLLAGSGSTRECIGSALRSIVDSDLAQPVRRGCLVANTAAELAGHDPEIARTVRTCRSKPSPPSPRGSTRAAVPAMSTPPSTRGSAPSFWRTPLPDYG